MRQPKWPLRFKERPDGGFKAWIDELPGCEVETDDGSLEDAFAKLEVARDEWVLRSKEEGRPLPPVDPPNFSGTIFIRTSPRLHELVYGTAKRQGVSMSQWVSEVLAQAVGAQMNADASEHAKKLKKDD